MINVYEAKKTINALACNITDVMYSRGITNKQLESYNFLSAEQISLIKNGQNKDVCLTNLICFCRLIKLHPNDLLKGNNSEIWNNSDTVTDQMVSKFAKALREGHFTRINNEARSASYLFNLCSWFGTNQIYRIEKIRGKNRDKNARRMTLIDLISYSRVFNVAPEIIMDELIQFIHDNN